MFWFGFVRLFFPLTFLDTPSLEPKHQETGRDLQIWSFPAAQTLQSICVGLHRGRARGKKVLGDTQLVTNCHHHCGAISENPSPAPRVLLVAKKGDHKQTGAVGGPSIWAVQMEGSLTLHTQCRMLQKSENTCICSKLKTRSLEG